MSDFGMLAIDGSKSFNKPKNFWVAAFEKTKKQHINVFSTIQLQHEYHGMGGW